MRRVRLFALIALGSAVALSVRAATVQVYGTGGATGTTGALGIFDPNSPYSLHGGPGGNGGDGGAANALANETGASNSAGANGGTGGFGGNGGDFVVPDPYPPTLFDTTGGPGGKGGAGGAAQATATTSGAFSAASANANAIGGNAGQGGSGGNYSVHNPYTGSPGSGGSGGRADALSQATSTAGSATAISNANGGAGNAGGYTANSIFDNPFVAYPSSYFVGPGGVGGDASAVSQATATGDTDAEARAYAGAQGTGNLTSSTGATATANASAASQSGNATATAEATGGATIRGETLSDIGGRGTATAVATSVTGNATAIARNFAGAAAPGYQGPRSDSPYFPGGPGADASVLDAVSGSAGGLLTLDQEVTAGGTDGVGSGNATSLLHAANPGGGALLAQVKATGGYGGSHGGSATANVQATVTNAARVEADATVMPGAAAEPIMCGIYVCGFSYSAGGDGNASALAVGLGESLARATAQTTNATTTHVASDSRSAGAISRAVSTLDVKTPFDGTSFYYGSFTDTQVDTSAAVNAGIHSAAPLPGAAVARSGEADLFAAPSAADAGAWTMDRLHVSAALQGAQVLALGSLGAGGRNPRFGIEYSGSMEVDLANSELDPSRHLALAFMDPTSTGAGIDVLHLTLSRSGQTVFDRSFSDSASAIAVLGDAVFDLGSLLALGHDTTALVLSFDLHFGADPAASFATRLALLATPEPAPAVMLLVLSAAVALRRQRGGPSR